MKKYSYFVAGACALLGLTSVAHAVNIDINVGTPAPVYVAPPPVYVAPRPVYMPPPAQVVVVPGWYGERYYDGRRYWSRHDWEARRRYDGDRRHHETIATTARQATPRRASANQSVGQSDCLWRRIHRVSKFHQRFAGADHLPRTLSEFDVARFFHLAVADGRAISERFRALACSIRRRGTCRYG